MSNQTNQHAIILEALKNSPKTTIELRHDYGVMMPAARVRELRLAGYKIKTVRVVGYTPDGIKHYSIAQYLMGHKPEFQDYLVCEPRDGC